ncbi:MAG: DUF1640 domain-containing protein [Candidatus Portiera sp.]|nr:DUF1640 domain-containing protein [Portiera sp.]
MDTHEVIGTLTAEYDLDLKQAEGVVYAVRQGHSSSIEGLATKQDLSDVRTELKQDIADVKAELKQDITDVKAELKQDIADVKQDIADVKVELKQDIADVKQDIVRIDSNMKLLMWITPIAVSIATMIIKFV